MKEEKSTRVYIFDTITEYYTFQKYAQENGVHIGVDSLGNFRGENSGHPLFIEVLKEGFFNVIGKGIDYPCGDGRVGVEVERSSILEKIAIEFMSNRAGENAGL